MSSDDMLAIDLSDSKQVLARGAREKNELGVSVFLTGRLGALKHSSFEEYLRYINDALRSQLFVIMLKVVVLLAKFEVESEILEVNLIPAVQEVKSKSVQKRPQIAHLRLRHTPATPHTNPTEASQVEL